MLAQSLQLVAKSLYLVGDPTDPGGTLQPNLHPEIGTGDHYEPLFCPDFNRIIKPSCWYR
jgi:hypothetical protein